MSLRTAKRGDVAAKKSQFLSAVTNSRAEWERVLSGIPDNRMIDPVLAGGWSVKDLVAHIAWSEHQMIGVIAARALVGSDLWDVSEDERNAAVYAENRDRSLSDVVDDERSAYEQLVTGLESLTDDDFEDSSRFRDMVPGVAPWQIFAGSTFIHYDDHLAAVKAWLTLDSAPH